MNLPGPDQLCHQLQSMNAYYEVTEELSENTYLAIGFANTLVN